MFLQFCEEAADRLECLNSCCNESGNLFNMQMLLHMEWAELVPLLKGVYLAVGIVEIDYVSTSRSN